MSGWTSDTAKSPKGEQVTKGAIESAGMWISIGINNAGNDGMVLQTEG